MAHGHTGLPNTIHITSSKEWLLMVAIHFSAFLMLSKTICSQSYTRLRTSKYLFSKVTFMKTLHLLYVLKLK